jgi:hypothetical protein
MFRMSAIQTNISFEKTKAGPIAGHKQPKQVMGETAPRRALSNYLPERYSIKSNGDERVLICLEAPNLNVHIEPGLAINASMARKSPAGTIFLDGIAQCEPFMDHERQVYNLDHHEGCVRAFTLATCEQTLVMYMKGLDLRGREWHIFANDPDLDAILAIWILLNHARIGRQDNTQRRILFALVRYEGIIDALGLELKELSALPPELMRKIQRVVDHLRSDEIALKKEGRWEKTDFLTHTISILHKIDQIFFKPSDFADYKGIEELARIDLTDQRIAAVVEADMGIYEIEPHLNKLYGNRLGIVFLKKGEASYTARQMDLFMPINLEDIYERLNFVDPAVKCRTQANKWGGATDIGGSPRDTGTLLTPLEIAQTCRDAVQRLGLVQQAYRFGLTAALVSLILLCAQIIRIYWSPADWFQSGQLHAFWNLPDFGFLLALAMGTALSLLFIAYCKPWQYGWIRPVGTNWWFFLPVVLAAGFFGGVWMPESLQKGQSWNLVIALGILGLPLTAELLFRSLAHGLLTQGAKIQRSDTRWFLSWPIAGSTILYMVYILSLSMVSSAQISPIQPGRLAISLVSAALFGLSLGMVRERSQSLFPAMLFHVLAAAVAFIITRLL